MKSDTVLQERKVKMNCVMIGDIVKSRDMSDWADVFAELTKTLESLNREFPKDILVPFGPTVGDEFQGALIDSKNAYSIYANIKNRLPAGFYCGLGIGEVEKPLEEDTGMRGDAFYRARTALQSCKKEKRSLLVRSSDTGSQRDEVINTVLHLIESLESSWTKRQREITGYLRSHPDYTYEQLANRFTVTKQAVYKILKAANWEAFTEGESLVKELLARISAQS